MKPEEPECSRSSFLLCAIALNSLSSLYTSPPIIEVKVHDAWDLMLIYLFLHGVTSVGVYIRMYKEFVMQINFQPEMMARV